MHKIKAASKKHDTLTDQHQRKVMNNSRPGKANSQNNIREPIKSWSWEGAAPGWHKTKNTSLPEPGREGERKFSCSLGLEFPDSTSKIHMRNVIRINL